MFLVLLVAASNKQIHHLAPLTIIHPVARPEMDTHFRDAAADWATVAEIASLGRDNPRKYPRAPFLIFQAVYPLLKNVGFFHDILHGTIVSDGIQFVNHQ